MTQQPQVPQPEGQQPAPASGGSGFDASGFQKDLTTKTISVNNAWILTGAGGLLFISIFLPWMTVSASGLGSSSANGSDKSGLLFVTALLVAAAGALVALRKIPFWGVVVAAAAALIQLIITFSAMGDVSDAKSALSFGGLGGSGVKVSNGIGLWLSLLLSIGVIGFAVYTYLKDKVDYVSTGPLFPQQNNNQPPTPQGPAA